MFESRESIAFDLASVLAGGAGLSRSRKWLALAPHLEEPVEVSMHEMELLGSLSCESFSDVDVSGSIETRGMILRLLATGLLIDASSQSDVGARDVQVRANHWWPLAAVAHRFGRWYGVDAVKSTRASDMETADGLLKRMGLPPPTVPEFCKPEKRLKLTPSLERSGTRRTTCRNFDVKERLRFEVFSAILHSVFGARSERALGAGASVLKKHVPSAGALHPVECFLLITRVEGIAPGLYHYHCLDHSLEPLPPPADPLDAVALRMLAGQHWFADAPVLVALVARFQRCFWKYRGHPKAYRTLMLDAGHLSQALYTAATEQQLGAFVTSAINEGDVEAGFGLDPLEYGVVAMSGFGARASEQRTTEFDPEGLVWPTSVANTDRA